MNENMLNKKNIKEEIESEKEMFSIFNTNRKMRKKKSFRMIQNMKRNQRKNKIQRRKKKELKELMEPEKKMKKKNMEKKYEHKCMYKNIPDPGIVFQPENCKDIKKYKVVMLGCCKDVANYLHKNLMILELLGDQFLDYRMVIYENDSSDITRQILMEYKNERFKCIFENDIKIKERTERLAYIRNILLDNYYQIQETFHAEYMMMIDLDDRLFSGKIINSISSCFGFDVNQWDVLTGNQSKIYYDIYALRIKNMIEYDFLVEILKIKKKISDKRRRKLTHRILNRFNYPPMPPSYLVPVESAFGAVSIYKSSSIKDAKYIGMNGNIPICEHVPFNKTIRNNGGKIFINSRMLTE